jgi:hypothetical protein
MSRESYFGSPKIVFFYTAHKNVIYLWNLVFVIIECLDVHLDIF